MRNRRRLFATVLSLTPIARAIARSLIPSSRRCAALAAISRNAGVEPASTIVTTTGIEAAVRILCVRVHWLQRVRRFRTFAPLQVFSGAKVRGVRTKEFRNFAGERTPGRPHAAATCASSATAVAAVSVGSGSWVGFGSDVVAEA